MTKQRTRFNCRNCERPLTPEELDPAYKDANCRVCNPAWKRLVRNRGFLASQPGASRSKRESWEEQRAQAEIELASLRDEEARMRSDTSPQQDSRPRFWESRQDRYAKRSRDELAKLLVVSRDRADGLLADLNDEKAKNAQLNAEIAQRDADLARLRSTIKILADQIAV